MKLRKVTIGELLLFALIFFYLSLMQVTGTFVVFIRNALFACAVVYLFQKRYVPSKGIMLVACYVIYMIVLAYVKGVERANFTTILYYAKIVVFLAVLEQRLEAAAKKTVDLFFAVTLVTATINTICVILFPYGTYQYETDWGIWHGVYYQPHWPLGNKNTMLTWYLLLFMLLCFKQQFTERRNDALGWYVIILSILTMLLVNSSTSIVAVVLVAGAYLVAMNSSKEMKLRIRSGWLLIGLLVLELMVLFGFTTFLEPIIKQVFNKDLTFSMRTELWKIVFVFILQDPWFGSGLLSNEESGVLLDNKGWVNAHNQLLNTVWQGGIVHLLILLLFLVCVVKSIKSVKSNKKRFVIQMIFCAWFIGALFEVVLSRSESWILLFLIYKLMILDKEKEEVGVQYANRLRRE